MTLCLVAEIEAKEEIEMSKLHWLITSTALFVLMLLPNAANAQAGFYVDPFGNVRSSGYYDAWGNYIVGPGPGPYPSYYGHHRFSNRVWYQNRWHDRSDWRNIVNSILYNIP